jgi:hypothetical protein
MSTVVVEIDPRWVKFVRSPVFTLVSALTGVSVTFAPYYLYRSARGEFYPGYERFTVPLCFALIYLVGFVYIRLGNKIAKELRKAHTNPPESLNASHSL